MDIKKSNVFNCVLYTLSRFVGKSIRNLYLVVEIESVKIPEWIVLKKVYFDYQRSSKLFLHLEYGRCPTSEETESTLC